MVNVKNDRKRVFAALASVFLVILMLMSTCMCAFASGDDSVDAAARQTLIEYVQGKVNDNQYAVNGGGYLKGSEVLMNDGKINPSTFEKLTSAAQSKLVSDIATASNEKAAEYDPTDPNKNTVSNGTVENWWRELQQTKGVGTKFLNVMLENTKPDFVTANQIYKPFSGIVGTVLGLIAIIGMAILAIVMVSDIMYIALPPMRMLVQEGGKDGQGKSNKGSFLISSDAIYAVEQAENNNDGNKKHAIGIYFKRRVFMLILLGICMLYLVSGSIFTLVGTILDLVSGFIGF